MTHPDMEQRVDAYLDGELTIAESGELEAHLAHCPECTRFRDGRVALRSAIKTQVPGFTAPDVLRRRVSAALLSQSQGREPRRLGTPAWWRTLAFAASVAIVALGSWRLGLRQGSGDALADQVLASHVRSLMPGHLTDVISSDQHTVKPWFDGKVDFSPAVYDFSGQGYPLLGGRLDYLNGRSVAALVYGRRQHLINVYLWPSHDSATGTHTLTRQGYHMLRWNTSEYSYWVVSDLGLNELQQFTGLLAAGDSAAARSE